MHSLKAKKIDLITFGLPLLIILASVFVALSSLAKTHPEVTSLLAYDLAVLSPLLYFFLIRKRKISKLTVIPFITVGIALAAILLPENQHDHLNIVKAIAIPAIEIFLVVTILRKVYLMSKSVKANALTTDDAYSIIKKSSKEAFGNGKFIRFLISEMAVFYYAFVVWKKKKRIENEFTNYKDNGSLPLIWGLVFVMSIETAALHFLIAKWSFIGAYTLTILSLYSTFMVFGHLKALSRRPSLLTTKKLILKNGLLADIEINLNEIDKVELCDKQITSENLKIGNLGLSKESTGHNIAIFFSNEQTIEKVYGFTENCSILLLYMDDKNKFLEKINTALKKS